MPRPAAMTASPAHFTAPLGGTVSQWFQFWAGWFENVGQIGLINIELGHTANPALEQKILSEVASYGRQLGRISEALEVLLDRNEAAGVLDPAKLDPADRRTLEEFRSLLSEIKRVKGRDG